MRIAHDMDGEVEKCRIGAGSSLAGFTAQDENEKHLQQLLATPSRIRHQGILYVNGADLVHCVLSDYRLFLLGVSNNPKSNVSFNDFVFSFEIQISVSDDSMRYYRSRYQ
jgi:hypothetical protein